MVIGKTETVVKSGDLNLLPFRRALEGQALYVGITGATDSRGGTERMGNAALAALHAAGRKWDGQAASLRAPSSFLRWNRQHFKQACSCQSNAR